MVEPITVEASWIDRDNSGIYFQGGDENSLGQGLGELNEDDNAEEVEVDEGSSFFLELINTVICWLLSSIGRMLFSMLELMGASLDRLIYGRLVSENTLFTFDLGVGNIYGIVAFAIYGIMSSVMVAFIIPIFSGKIVIGAWRRGDFVRSSLKEAFSFLIFSLLLLILMPFFLDTFLFLRDVLLYIVGTEGATSLFGSGSSTSIVLVLGAAANDNIVSGVIFVAAVLLNLYFLIGYVGVALSMTANFILFPLVILKMSFDRQVLKNWIWEMISCMSVPIIDSILIMIPSFLGIYASELTTLESMGVSVIQLIICYMIIPIRTYSRSILGMRINPLENSGLATASFMGMAAARGIKNAFSDSRESRKNAELDRQRAEAEDDLAQLDKGIESETFVTARAESAEHQMPSADSIQQMLNKKHGMNDMQNFLEESDKEIPFGKEQSYADELQSHINGQEDEQILLPKEAYLSPEEKLQNARKLKELNSELSKAQKNKEELQVKKNAILDDDYLSDEEKLERINSLNEAIADENNHIEGLNRQREEVMSVDDKIRVANEKKSQLEEEYQKTADIASMDKNAKESKLDAINEQIHEMDQEILGLQKQKQRMLLEEEKVALTKEPAMLRKEYVGLKNSQETLNQQREELIRQRNQLKGEQGNYAIGTKEYAVLSEKINGLDQQIGNKDQELNDNFQKQNTIVAMLSKQQSGLYDRQAYNLHERVKAQAEYDNAKERAENLQQRLKDAENSKISYLSEGTLQRRKLEGDLKAAQQVMEKAESRIGELSREDRRIASRLHEISPELNQISSTDLKKAKREQAMKRAEIQKEIASVQERMEDDPDNRQHYRRQIAKLQSEVADCNYQSARIDQLMEGICENLTTDRVKSGHSFSTSSGTLIGIGAEYERKRVAIMERYANIDNFEQPEFVGISREKRAQLYRERAMRTQKIYARRCMAGVVGAAVGGVMGVWLGSSGVTSGTLIMHSVGAELGENSALKHMARTSTSQPVDYKDIPMEFKIASDLRDNTYEGQARTVERVQAELRDSLQSDRFQQAVHEELASNNLIKVEIKKLFKKHGVTKENYESKRGELLTELRSQVVKTVEHAEEYIVEQCAGREYAALSEDVKRRIVRSVAKPNMEVFNDLCESQYLCKKWEPYYEEYFDE